MLHNSTATERISQSFKRTFPLEAFCPTCLYYLVTPCHRTRDSKCMEHSKSLLNSKVSVSWQNTVARQTWSPSPLYFLFIPLFSSCFLQSIAPLYQISQSIPLPSKVWSFTMSFIFYLILNLI